MPGVDIRMQETCRTSPVGLHCSPPGWTEEIDIQVVRCPVMQLCRTAKLCPFSYVQYMYALPWYRRGEGRKKGEQNGLPISEMLDDPLSTSPSSPGTCKVHAKCWCSRRLSNVSPSFESRFHAGSSRHWTFSRSHPRVGCTSMLAPS
jgi:hypothetical protein